MVYLGDSGGGVFTMDGQLAGIQDYAVTSAGANRPQTDGNGFPIAWYGASSVFIDLSHYRIEICRHIEASGGSCDRDGGNISDHRDK
jgi:hypothetical protein